MRKITLELEETLPGLMKVRQESGLTTRQVAHQAGLELREVYLAEIGVPVSESIAWRILYAFNQLTGCSHTLETVMIHVKTETSEQGMCYTGA